MNSCCRVTLHVAESDGALLHVDSDNAAALSIGGEIYSVETPPYEGEYEVTPKTFEQILETQNKRMTDNVTVYEIPYHQTSNPAGGYTVSIAS